MISVIDTESNTVVKINDVGHFPYGLEYNPSNLYIYVENHDIVSVTDS